MAKPEQAYVVGGPGPPEYPLLHSLVSRLDLSLRALDSLRDAGIERVADLLRHTELDLPRLPRFGRRCRREIQETLASRGLALKPA